MKLSTTLEKAFNAQITLELSASTVYRQLAIELAVFNLPGMAGWFHAQAAEELIHAHKFIDHMVDRGNHPQLGAVPAPKVKVGSVLDAFQAALAHEQKVSAAIRDLYRAAEKDGDLDSRPMLNWFIEEQIEEEATVGEIVGRIELIDGDGPGLLKLDEELGQRTAAGGTPTE